MQIWIWTRNLRGETDFGNTPKTLVVSNEVLLSIRRFGRNEESPKILRKMPSRNLKQARSGYIERCNCCASDGSLTGQSVNTINILNPCKMHHDHIIISSLGGQLNFVSCRCSITQVLWRLEMPWLMPPSFL